MVILVTGGTGFIGGNLADYLVAHGHKVRILTRNPERYASYQSKDRLYVKLRDDLKSEIEHSDVVINLAGENLFDQRWTETVRRRIIESRTGITSSLVEAIQKAKKKPDVMISASGSDFYGDRGNTLITEESGPGEGFLTEVCIAWEEAAKPVESTGVRLAIPRLGVVLGKNGGALQKMMTPFRLFAGGPLGDGSQYMAWVHMKDVIRAFMFVIDNKQASGVFNLTSPDPVTMSRFASALGSAMGRPSWFPVPGFVLKIAVGDASKAVLASHRIIPANLQKWGFEFDFTDIETAMTDILKR
jgi:uncharacterized protein